MSESVKHNQPRGFDDYDVCLGDLMRGERATLGFSLLDVQREIRIKALYIAAIEDGNLNAFQTAGFVAGYVRSYAKFLGMDPDKSFQRFCEETQFSGVHNDIKNNQRTQFSITGAHSKTSTTTTKDPFANSKFLMAPPSAGVLDAFSARAFGSTVVLGGLVLALGYGGWNVLQEMQRVQFAPVEQSIAVTEQGTGLAAVSQVGAEIAPELPKLQTTALDQLYRPQELEEPKMVARDGPIAFIDPTQFSDLGSGVVSEAPLLAASQPRVTVDGPPPTDIVAINAAWIRVYLTDGTVLFEQTLDAGQRYRVPANIKNPLFRSGNSSSVFVMIGDKTYGPVGKDTSPVKDVQLSEVAVTKQFSIATAPFENPLGPPVNLAATDTIVIQP